MAPGGTRTFYLNGRADGTGPAQAADGRGDLFFGSDKGNPIWVGQESCGHTFKGKLRDVRLYGRALGAAEVAGISRRRAAPELRMRA